MKTFFWVILLAVSLPLAAQPADSLPPRLQLRGYVKDLQSLFFLHDIPLPGINVRVQNNFIHNRINLRYRIGNSLGARIEFRNRLFWGDGLDENYVRGLNAGNDYWDWSLEESNGTDLAYQFMIDRAFVVWMHGRWEVRVGRQRINWGISSVWNPNDLFNAFSFTDFDYEERPGSDALLVRYNTGAISSIEIAGKLANRTEDAVIGALWKFNRWNYDFQLLAAYANGDLALGAGWAGSLGNWGFKGEATAFTGDTLSFAGTIGLDYLTGKSLYFSAGYLYNSNGQPNGSLTQLFSFELSARNLYPYRHALFVQGNYPFTPLLSAGMALIYSPNASHPLFINPVFTYSVASNFDLDLVGQIAFNEEDGYKSPVQAVFLRVKFSY